MTTHPILGPIAPVESLGRATLEAIESSGGCSIPKVLVDINARAGEIDAERPVASIDLEALRGHTPGPWKAAWSKYDEGVFLAQAGMPTNRVLAKFDGDGMHDRPDEQSIADAHLIAIAPTLLAEYERLLAELTTRRARDAEVEALVAACRLARSYMSEAIEYETPCAKRDGATVDAAIAPFTGAKP